MKPKVSSVLRRYQDLLLVLTFGLLYGVMGTVWLSTGRTWTHPLSLTLATPVVFAALILAAAALPAWRLNDHWIRGTVLFTAAAFGLGWTIVLFLHLVLPWRAEPLGCGALAWEVAWDRLNPGRCDGPLPLQTVGPLAWVHLVPTVFVVAVGSLVPAALFRVIRQLAQRALRPAT